MVDGWGCGGAGGPIGAGVKKNIDSDKYLTAVDVLSGGRGEDFLKISKTDQQ